MPIIEITSLNHPGVEIFSTLTEAQLRKEHEKAEGIFIAESPKVINVALNAGHMPLAMMCEKRHITATPPTLSRVVAIYPYIPENADCLQASLAIPSPAEYCAQCAALPNHR